MTLSFHRLDSTGTVPRACPVPSPATVSERQPVCLQGQLAQFAIFIRLHSHITFSQTNLRLLHGPRRPSHPQCSRSGALHFFLLGHLGHSEQRKRIAPKDAEYERTECVQPLRERERERARGRASRVIWKWATAQTRVAAGWPECGKEGD